MKSSLVRGRHILLSEIVSMGPHPSPPLMAVWLRVTRAPPLWSGPVLVQLCPNSTWRGERLPSRAFERCSDKESTSGAYQACGEAASALHATVLLQVHQAKTLRDLHEGDHDPQVLRASSQVMARSVGRAMSTVVV